MNRTARRIVGIAALVALAAGMASALAPTASTRFRIRDAVFSGTRAPEATGTAISARQVRFGVAIPRLVVTQGATGVEDWKVLNE